MKERRSLPRIPRGLGAFLIDLKSEVSFSAILGFHALLFSTVANLRPQKFLLKFMRTGIARMVVMTSGADEAPPAGHTPARARRLKSPLIPGTQ
jgi:hypothetical protein